MFLFSSPVTFPPSVHAIKAFYVTSEMLRRHIRVTWLTIGNLGDNFQLNVKDRVTFATIPLLGRRLKKLRFWIQLGIVIVFCKITKVSGVYVDDWMFYRGDINKFVAYASSLKRAGVRFVFDQRDPFIDFEISEGILKEGSRKHEDLVKRYEFVQKISNFLSVPSHRYEVVMIEEEGVAPNKVFGSFRGIDSRLFNADIKPIDLGTNSWLAKKFVIGWFGLMHPHRQIRQVIVPLIRTVGDIIPNAHVLIGGEGPEKKEFAALNPEYSNRFSMLGFIPYSSLPRYIAACDVLLCPVDTRYRFSRKSIWLKIFESIAVGRPIIATRTDVSDDDLLRLKGVVWVEGGVRSYLEALCKVHSEYENYHKKAIEQAKNFDEYTISRTIPKLVDRILLSLGKS